MRLVFDPPPAPFVHTPLTRLQDALAFVFIERILGFLFALGIWYLGRWPV